MHQFFICNQKDVDLKLKTLTKTGTTSDEWTDVYIDKITDEIWLLTKYDSEYQSEGVSVLKRQPEPKLDELINIAMTSLDISDIIAASLELSFREKERNEDFRTSLLNRLLQVDISSLTDFERNRLKLIVYESTLYDATNRRNIVGKNYAEIQNDSNYYRAIAQKANDILLKIKN